MEVNKRMLAFKHAFQGIKVFIKEGVHAKVHAVAAVLVVVLGVVLKLSSLEWVAILLCIALVLSLEAINSAIEYLTDLASPNYHELAGKCKDVAAGAVLIAAIFSVIIAVIIFVPKVTVL